MSKSRTLSALLALALTVSIVPATMAQDDDALENDPAVEALLDEPVEITGADIESLDLILHQLETNVEANIELLDQMQNRTDQVPHLRERIKANNQVTKAAVEAITSLRAQVGQLGERVETHRLTIHDMRANLRGINAALERLGESGCTGPNCTD